MSPGEHRASPGHDQLVHMTAPLIDQRSASIRLTPADVAEWANGRRVFISSLISDMPEERGAARRAILNAGADPVMFEELGGQDISADQAYLAGVRSSDVYVGLLGPRYGVRMPDGYSATHAEFLEAERIGLRLCLFVNGMDSGHMDGPQRDLISGVRNAYTTSSWSDPADLEQRITARLADLAGEEIAPWVKLGDVVIRAREVSTSGTAVNVRADVRSAQVLAVLDQLRERGLDVPFASPTRASTVRVIEFRSTERLSGVHAVEIGMRITGSAPAPMRMSVNGVAADELEERALSDALFGTSLLPRNLGWAAPLDDPIDPLRGLGLDDVVLRPVCRLLISAALLSSGAATTIDSFVLGPRIAGTRILRVSWTPPEIYANGPAPTPRMLHGEVQGL